MAVDQQPNTQLSFFEASLNIYRKTLKRFRLFHLSLHWLMTHIIIPLLENGRRFYTMPDDPFWFRVELLTTRHETETTVQLHRLLQPGMTFLDIGAHVGYYSRMASHLVGDKGRVIAFEPHPRNHSYLARNVGSRQNVTLMQVALAEEEGTAELYDYLMMSASGSLHYDENIRDVQMAQLNDTDVAPRIDANFEPQIYMVRTAPADRLLDAIDISQVDCIKMDIEGAELDALRGMQRTIQQSPGLRLVMEYNPLGLRAFGHDPVAALTEVLNMGFSRMYVIEADSSLRNLTANEAAIVELTQQLMRHMGVINLLFVRE